MITFGSLDWFAETDEVSSSRVALGDRAQMYRWEAVRVFEGQVYSLLVGFSTNALLKKNVEVFHPNYSHLCEFGQ